MPELERTTFERSRASEYFDSKELQAMTGREVRYFACVVLKELLDNSIDACEGAGVAPEIGVEITDSGDSLRLTISDNGPGIPPETVRRMLNFETRTSDKAAYRSPTRGAQGNALKTVIGIPHALGSREPVVIEGRGIRHEITAWIDPAGELRIEHDEKDVNGAGGTRFSVSLPTGEQVFDPEWWVRAFALVNPHVRISLFYGSDHQGNSGHPGPAKVYKPSIPGLKKYRPSDPTSAHWYGPKALKRLVFAHIGDARSGGRDLPLGEFMRQFRGLSSPAKAKTVRAAVPEISYLSDFEREPEAVGVLLEAMRAESRPPSHDTLGAVGEERLQAVLEDSYEVQDLTYKKLTGRFPSGLPYVFEFAIATIGTGPGHLYTAINHSPTFDDPLWSKRLSGPEYDSRGIRSFLREGHAEPDGYDSYAPSETAAVAHLITPAPQFLDMGKTSIATEEEGQ